MELVNGLFFNFYIIKIDFCSESYAKLHIDCMNNIMPVCNQILNEINNAYETHRLSKLKELCEKFNAESTELYIDCNKYTTAHELIFCLWQREIDVGVLAFGYPYDDILKIWAPDLNARGDIVTTDIEHNNVYKTYMHSDKLIYFLYYSLLLPKTNFHN